MPAGFGNGFYTVSEIAFVHYKQTSYDNPKTERILRWNDAAVGVTWPTDTPDLSDRDRNAPDDVT